MEQLDWNVWTGVEVEGRLVGMPTLFIRDIPPGVDIAPALAAYRHVWLCEEYVRKHGYALAEELSKAGVLVSIELREDMLNDVPFYVQRTCHLVLAVLVSPETATVLKPTDTVRLDADVADVYTMTFGQVQHTTPDDYRYDQRIA